MSDKRRIYQLREKHKGARETQRNVRAHSHTWCEKSAVLEHPAVMTYCLSMLSVGNFVNIPPDSKAVSVEVGVTVEAREEALRPRLDDETAVVLGGV